MKKLKVIVCITLISLFMAGVCLLHADWDFVAGGYISNVQFVGNDGWATVSEGRIKHTSDGGATWEYQETGTTERIYGVSFVDNLTGWVDGNDGLIFHTTDGGTTWIQQNSGISSRLETICFLDSLNGWAAGSYGKILYTTDGGTTWTLQTSGITNRIYSIYFVDYLNGWAVASSHKIIHTTDGGVNWIVQTSPTTSSMKEVIFYDVNEGWAVGSKKIIHTVDGGANWELQTSGAAESLYGLGMGDSLHLWAVGINGEIRYTDDGGTTWNSQGGFSLDWFWDAYFTDSSTGWIVGAGGAIYKTTDGGSNWVAQATGTSSGLRRTVCLDDQNFWGCGYKGYIIHSGDGGLTWENKDSGFDDWIWDITFAPDSLHGWAAGDDQPSSTTPILATIDGGETWTQQTTDITVDIVGIQAVSNTEVFAVAKGGFILHTTDGGSTWNQQTSGVTVDFKSLEFKTEDIGWVVGKDGTILYTNDGGTNWNPQTSNTTETLYDVSFVDTLIGWVVGLGSTILYTNDGGTTWTPQTSGVSWGFTRLSAIDENEVWIVDDQALHTTDGGATWIEVSIPCTIGLWGVDFANSNLGVAMGNGGIVTRYTYEAPDIVVSPDTVKINVSNKSQGFTPHFYEKHQGNYTKTRCEIVEKELSPKIIHNQKPKDYLNSRLTPDTLFYDDGTFEHSLGISGSLTPSGSDTYGFTTKFQYNSTYLMGVMLHFGSFTGTSYRLYVWADNNGVPGSGSDPLYENDDMPVPNENDWTFIDLSDINVFLTTTFWIGICYNDLADTPEWYLGYDSNTADNHSYINLNGTPSGWDSLEGLGYGYAFGVRAIVAQEGAPTGTMIVQNNGVGTLYITDISSSESWIESIFPSHFDLTPDNSQAVLIEADPVGLPNGTYNGTLHIISTDPDENPYDEPVQMIISITTPAPVSDLAISVDENNNAVLNWSPVTGASSYKIYSSPEPYAEFSTWQYLDTVSYPITSWSEPASGAKKFYRVTANN